MAWAASSMYMEAKGSDTPHHLALSHFHICRKLWGTRLVILYMCKSTLVQVQGGSEDIIYPYRLVTRVD